MLSISYHLDLHNLSDRLRRLLDFRCRTGRGTNSLCVLTPGGTWQAGRLNTCKISASLVTAVDVLKVEGLHAAYTESGKVLAGKQHV